ncbi:FKBP-type peptidyl-prolyl cis-trans isomerase [Candidatus Magnetomonas plexicatena]|uniref:FKBP-type peptidyl-prolyl cis-trans isomerase n=1 Tax=Candidatus Magnetomonas plexicatena TaxID=2552947 RepID=UPI001C76964C|nr:peptidylprolyl isomerase [Nitrospirales bacterium LBB_01]
MAQVKMGDKVRVHYKGYLSDGSVFDSSLEREPMEFTLGEGMLIAGFENGVLGMNEGDTKTVKIPPEDGYGPYREDMVLVVERSQVPPNINPYPGMVLQVRSNDGSSVNVTVAEIADTSVTLDGNHPLAGKELNFDITVVEVI